MIGAAGARVRWRAAVLRADGGAALFGASSNMIGAAGGGLSRNVDATGACEWGFRSDEGVAAAARVVDGGGPKPLAPGAGAARIVDGGTGGPKPLVDRAAVRH